MVSHKKAKRKSKKSSGQRLCVKRMIYGMLLFCFDFVIFTCLGISVAWAQSTLGPDSASGELSWTYIIGGGSYESKSENRASVSCGEKGVCQLDTGLTDSYNCPVYVDIAGGTECGDECCIVGQLCRADGTACCPMLTEAARPEPKRCYEEGLDEDGCPVWVKKETPECNCEDGVVVDGVCVICPEGQVFDEEKQACDCIQGELKDGRCIESECNKDGMTGETGAGGRCLCGDTYNSVAVGGSEIKDQWCQCDYTHGYFNAAYHGGSCVRATIQVNMNANSPNSNYSFTNGFVVGVSANHS